MFTKEEKDTLLRLLYKEDRRMTEAWDHLSWTPDPHMLVKLLILKVLKMETK